MSLPREKVCELTSRKLAAAAPTLPRKTRVVGLDGFVDEIIAVVDKRHDYDRLRRRQTIADFGREDHAAAGQSSNYELVVKQMKLGGNGPIMANALASASGMDVTYVGNLGYPTLHPVFDDFARRAKVISIGEPGPHRRPGVRRRQAHARQAHAAERRELGQPASPASAASSSSG